MMLVSYRVASLSFLSAVDMRLLQVDDCIAKFLYMKSMTAKVKQLKDEGKPMPKDYQQLEKEFGKPWSACKYCVALISSRPD